MDIKLNKKSQTEASVKISLNEADYQPKVEEKIKEYAKKVQMKGFRPGKVPPSLVQKMYGKGILVEEISQLVHHALQDYIKENNIELIGDPLPAHDENSKIDWENQKDFEFTYELGLAGDFSYDFSKVKVTSYEIEVDDNEIKTTIEDLQDRFGKVQHLEVSEEGTMLFGEIKGSGDEEGKNSMISLKQVEKKELQKFLGVKKEEVITFDIRKAFKDEGVISRVAGKTPADEEIKGTFEFTIKDINKVELAELNQDFFDKVFGKDVVKTEEEFRLKLKDVLQKNYQNEGEQKLLNDIKEGLMSNVSIELPEEFLKKWLFESNKEKISKEDIDKQFDYYAKELKWNLLQKKVAKEYEIKVEEEEVREKTKAFIRNQLVASGLGHLNEENLDAFASNYLNDEKKENFIKMFNEVYNEKVMSTVKSNISVKEKKISAEEFKKILEK